jgi:hypothetical protein
MSCIFIRCTYDKCLVMIQTLVVVVVGFCPLMAKPRISLDRNFVCELLLPCGTYIQRFGSISPAVTKRALLTDDDDGRYVIA